MFTNDGKLWHALPGLPDSIKPSPEKVIAAMGNQPLEFRVDADPDREWLCHVVPLGPPKHQQIGHRRLSEALFRSDGA